MHWDHLNLLALQNRHLTESNYSIQYPCLLMTLFYNSKCSDISLLSMHKDYLLVGYIIKMVHYLIELELLASYINGSKDQ